MARSRIGSFFRLLSLSKLAILGAALVTTGVIADVILIIGELFVFESNPYMGIFAFLVFPSVVVAGLVLVPFGILRTVRKAGSVVAAVELFERRKVDRVYILQTITLLTLLNLVIFGVVGYRGFHYTESVEFCGELCHEVMHPELTTYRRSPHSEVACVECHIGDGAGWFVKSKLSGARQVLAVLLDTYSRPIETPVHNLRPSREVCEVCHRPEIFHGNLIRVLEDYAADRDNTRTYTILNMRVGSGGEHGKSPHGIHWHVSRDHQVRFYATDEDREEVVWVELRSADGERRVWTRPGAWDASATPPSHEMRLMECVDCHNRPTHIYLSPDQALDEWMRERRIDPTIPWIRKEGEGVLTAEYATRADADAGIARLASIYEDRYPDVWAERAADIRATVPVLQEIHRLFVYPSMNIRWNTYPSLIGHSSPHTAACFRCHNGVLRDAEDRSITTDCDACHFVLADKQQDPPLLRKLEPR